MDEEGDVVRDDGQDLGITVLFVTHSIQEAIQIGSRVVVLARESASNGSRVVLDCDPRSGDSALLARQLLDIMECSKETSSLTLAGVEVEDARGQAFEVCRLRERRAAIRNARHCRSHTQGATRENRAGQGGHSRNDAHQAHERDRIVERNTVQEGLR